MKPPFKLLTFTLSLIMATISCHNENEQLSDEQISSNLLRIGGVEGSIDPALLVGQWNVVKFAYTTDGKKITNVTDIPIDPVYDIEWISSQNGLSIDEVIDMLTPKLMIPAYDIEWMASNNDMGMSVDEITASLLKQFGEETNLNDIWGLTVNTSPMFITSISGNLININSTGGFSLTVRPTDTAAALTSALSNAHSFVVKGYELIIYFKDIKKENLLILKKR